MAKPEQRMANNVYTSRSSATMRHEDSVRCAHSHQFDMSMMPGRAGETPVKGDQRRIQRFGEGDVRGIVSREVVPQIPDTRQQGTVRIAVQRKVGEYRESCAAAFAVDLTTDCVAAQRVRDLDIEQMRRVQRQARAE